MTAELCDCYPTKTLGVNAVLDAVHQGLPGWSIVVWGIDGEFHAVEQARERPDIAAAGGGNWLARSLSGRPSDSRRSRSIDRHRHDNYGSDSARPGNGGRTRSERYGTLQTGELVYAGVRRTPVCAPGDRAPVRGIATGLAAEIFASTLDVYLTLGDIESIPTDLSTADGRPATAHAALSYGTNGWRRPRRILGKGRT